MDTIHNGICVNKIMARLRKTSSKVKVGNRFIYNHSFYSLTSSLAYYTKLGNWFMYKLRKRQGSHIHICVFSVVTSVPLHLLVRHLLFQPLLLAASFCPLTFHWQRACSPMFLPSLLHRGAIKTSLFVLAHSGIGLFDDALQYSH